MDDDIHDIDGLFYNALEPKMHPPSEKVWAKINVQLNEINYKKKTALIVSRRVLSMIAALLFALLGATGYFIYQKKNVTNNKEVTANKNAQTFSTTKSIYKTDDKTQITDQQRNPPNLNLDNNDVSKSHPTLDIYAGKNKGPNNTVSDFHNKNQISLNTVVEDDKNNAANMQINNALKELNKKNINIKNANTNALNIGGSRNLKVNLLEKANGNDIVKAVENKPDNQNTSGTDERLLLKSSVGNNILIPKMQSAEANSTFKSRFDISATALTLQSVSAKSSKTKSIVHISPTKSRWYISLFGAQEWQGYQLQDNDDHQPQQNGSNDKNSIKHREDEDPSPAAGVSIGYKLGKKFSVETGIRFGGYHIRTDSAKIFAENNSGGIAYKLTTSSGFAYLKNTAGSLPLVGDSLTAQKVKQAINFVGIPIILRYKIGNRKLSFNPAIGIVLNLVTKSSVSANLNSGQGNDLQHVSLNGLRNFSAIVMFNPSIYYDISHKFSIGLEPYFNYSISPINNTNVVKSYPYGLGLGAGIKYSL